MGTEGATVNYLLQMYYAYGDRMLAHSLMKIGSVFGVCFVKFSIRSHLQFGYAVTTYHQDDDITSSNHIHSATLHGDQL